MNELTQEHRDELIDRLAAISTCLLTAPAGPARDDLKRELSDLARQLWLDGRLGS